MCSYTLNIGGRLLELGRPVVMGIVNVTPDSFYPGSRTQADDEIAMRARDIVAQGGAVIDVGACSTRPDCVLADEADETDRLRRGLTITRRVAPSAVLSVDTFRADVARMAVEEYGVGIINDISGGCDEMYKAVADLHVPYVLTYNVNGAYGDRRDGSAAMRHEDVVVDCLYFLAERISRLHDLGVCDIIVDPGFGFAKTQEQNYELLSALERLHELETPLLVGLSRKSMIYRALDCEPKDALNGSTVLHTIALQKGAHILRVHDVREAAEAVILNQWSRPSGNNSQFSILNSQLSNRIQCFSHSR